MSSKSMYFLEGIIFIINLIIIIAEVSLGFFIIFLYSLFSIPVFYRYTKMIEKREKKNSNVRIFMVSKSIFKNTDLMLGYGHPYKKNNDRSNEERINKSL